MRGYGNGNGFDFTEAVRRGIELLDAQAPEGWRKKINVATLDMSRGDECVLGQIYDNYYYGRYALGLRTERDAVTLGFDVDRRDVDALTLTMQWQSLTAEWQRQVQAAQASRSLFARVQCYVRNLGAPRAMAQGARL